MADLRRRKEVEVEGLNCGEGAVDVEEREDSLERMAEGVAEENSWKEARSEEHRKRSVSPGRREGRGKNGGRTNSFSTNPSSLLFSFSASSPSLRPCSLLHSLSSFARFSSSSIRSRSSSSRRALESRRVALAAAKAAMRASVWGREIWFRRLKAVGGYDRKGKGMRTRGQGRREERRGSGR